MGNQLWILGVLFLGILISLAYAGDEAMMNFELHKAEARWVAADKIFWELPAGEAWPTCQFWLITGERIVWANNDFLGGTKLPLTYLGKIETTVQLGIGEPASRMLPILRGQVIVAVSDRDGKWLAATATQNGGVIDELYAYDGNDLGVSWSGNVPALKLWAPTARSVCLHLFETAGAADPTAVYAMARGDRGVWSITGTSDWQGKFYLYSVEVFVLATGKVEKNLVTDPYSISLGVNSQKSHIVALTEPALKPAGWDKLTKPPLEAFTDMVIYELHVRDFSMDDHSVPPAYRGTYLAFTVPDTYGMRHLTRLAKAGLTHLHLLPVFDIATIEERRTLQQEPAIPALAPAASPLQQAAVGKVKDSDGYNWGYDPYHYATPEGSYAVDPNGSARILEFRRMVQSLSDAGLRVIMDVVYNHTHSCGQCCQSVLDRIVPGYYYRLDRQGNVQNTSCCPDTASERAMMEKLMVDTLLIWARHYKVDGFRFDLMGHHTKDNLKKIRAALDRLTLAQDGVDGSKIYLYGEGWKFGSLNDIMPSEACHQANMYGSGVGTFNDRIRDSARGGNFMHASKSDQGYLNGLHYDYNHDPANSETPQDLAQQKLTLLNYMDNIRIGLAGNLRDYPIVNCAGKLVKGGDIVYRGGVGAGYTADPQECINYVSAHDNYSLWDQIAAKAPFQTPGRTPATATVEERRRMQCLGMSLVALGQGIPFFDAGIELLRSKSGDGDSYNSGDWFNRLDFTGATNNWGVGLPPEWRNKAEWDFWQPRLADADLRPSRGAILASANYFEALLRIRKSSRLFRLRTALEIMTRVRFLDTDLGTDQTPGLIVMAISDNMPAQKILDPQRKWIICLFNATRDTVGFSHKALKGLNLALHPELTPQVDPAVSEARFDRVLGVIQVPPRSTIVYCQSR